MASRQLTRVNVGVGDISHQLRLIRILIRAKPGARIHATTALIDNGCNRTLIQDGFAKRIPLAAHGLDEVQLSGVHGSQQEMMADVTFEIGGKDGRFHQIPHAATKQRLGMPGPEIRWQEWARNNPPFDKIANELDNVDYKDVRLFLGLDVEHLFLPISGPDRWITSSDGQFRAYETALGWTIKGPLGEVSYEALASIMGFEKEEKSDVETSLLEAFQNFNDLEAIGIKMKTDKFSASERREYLRLDNLTRKLPDGRWEVPMLTREVGYLPASEPQAMNRLRSLYRRLDRDERLKKLYYEGIRQDEQLGYIRKLSPEEATILRQGIHWFLPHFPVFHPDKPDKCRRVLDAAAKNNGVSLNSFLNAGPNILNSLFGVLLRFRRGRVAVNADVNAMFSQVVVPADQQPLVAFLWNEDPKKAPDVYVNPRHIFGAACSPAVAIYALFKSAEHDQALSEIVKASFYMDDFYWSADNEDEIIQGAKTVETALQTGGFTLSKWTANCEKVVKAWPLEQRAKELKMLGSDLSGQLPVVKALGVAWNCAEDSFTFESRKLEKPVTTVASVLSVLASIFDPLGIIAPYTLTGKQLFQDVWFAELKWHAEVSAEFKKTWSAWIQDLSMVATLHMPRWYGFDTNSELTYFVFSDASTRGVGAVAYLKASTSRAMFVAAKTRVVPPKKRGNIPRLELQAAMIAARLTGTVLEELKGVKIRRIVFWSDSQTVLRWITNEEVRFDQYIANRVADIQERTQSWNLPLEFRFVGTHQNPADLASRGVPTGAKKFGEDFDYWLHGPAFLDGPEDQWPAPLPPVKKSSELLQQQLEEYALNSLFDTANYEQDDLVEFLIQNSAKENPTAEEVNDVEADIIREAQSKYYASEIKACRSNQAKTVIRRYGDFRRQQLWVDPKGILRLQTRLFASEDWPVEGALPAVLHRKHPFTALVVRDAHRQVEHQGYAATWAKVRERFYIRQGRALVKRLCQICPYCIKRRRRKMQPPMAGLHSSRLCVNKPAWTETGMDHFGPFDITGKQKRWGLIFICLTSRAVHLEDVDGLGMEPFCHALDRFINRRRRPDILRSDMGTTFVALAKVQEKTITEYAEELRLAALKRYRIDLRFNPAGAPHWGGSWERMIKEVKKILQSTLESVTKWRKDDFRTFLVRAEGILNRRPIAFGEDGEIITPNHILQPSADVAVGPPLGSPSIASLEAIKKAEMLFWQKWVKFYLPSISAQQVCGQVRNDVLLPGDKVLVREGSNPLVDSWTPGTIKEVFPSQDGVIRSVLVTTEAGDLYRDVTRISILDGPVLQRVKGLPSPSGGVSAPARLLRERKAPA